jgi:DNA-binding transcriptional ArsR family regulator
MAEADEYDRIFSALKHPVRRQILLFLETKGEASFAEIQKDQGTDDTGLLSYHLKELAPLITQSVRGRYGLSETGKASIVLFRKVEAERQVISRAVEKEIGKLASKIVFLFLILGTAMIAPLSVDIYSSIQYMNAAALSIDQIAIMLLAGLGGMLLSLVLFVIYDQHYFVENLRKNLIHAFFYSLGVSALSFLSTFSVYNFQTGTLNLTGGSWASDGTMVLILGVLRTASFIGTTPIITYAIVKRLKLLK